MGTPAERTRLAALLGVLLVVAAVALYESQRGPATESLQGVDEALSFTRHELPHLELERLTPVPDVATLSERNPFTYGRPPTPTPDLTPHPTATPAPTLPPRPTPTPRWIDDGKGGRLPPPPPFNRTYIGYFGPQRTPVAVFRKGEAVSVAIKGDVLDGTFVLRDVGLQSVTIGFVGYPEEVTSRVPLSEK
jgi:hypothetical protein